MLRVANELRGQRPFLYVRVDEIVVDDNFVLMELELIEPDLVMDIAAAKASEWFADAITDIPENQSLKRRNTGD